VPRHPLVARLLPRLLYQLVPAALVTVVGVLTLSNLSKAPETVPTAGAVQTAITTEAVFTALPREAAEPKPVPARTVVAAKPVAPMPPRKPESAPRQVASAPAPLPTVQIPEQPQVAAAAPAPDTSIMGRLRSATSMVTQAPRWAAQSVAGWFQDSAPPRPPAVVPQNFQAAM
jgi:hypothetical protein